MLLHILIYTKRYNHSLYNILLTYLLFNYLFFYNITNYSPYTHTTHYYYIITTLSIFCTGLGYTFITFISNYQHYVHITIYILNTLSNLFNYLFLSSILPHILPISYLLIYPLHI